MFKQIESQNPATKDQEPQLFPENIHGMQESVITCISLTSDFLIFATDVIINICFQIRAYSSSISLLITCFLVGKSCILFIGILDHCNQLSSFNGNQKYIQRYGGH